MSSCLSRCSGIGGFLFAARLVRAFQRPSFTESQTMKTITTFVAISFVLLLSACNTMQGLGEDVSKAGNKIENTAQSSK